MPRGLVALSLLLAVCVTAGCQLRPPGQILTRKAVSWKYAHSNFGVPFTPVSPGFGLIYSDYKAPLVTGLREQAMPPQKIGRAKTRFISFLWYPVFGGWDDASIEAAAQNGGITEVDYAEYKFWQILGTYGEFEVFVYGQ